MSNIINLSRREFLKAGSIIGGGLVLGFHIPFATRLSQAAEEAKFAPNAFLRIDKEGAVTVIVPQSDMGQGVLTSLPMIVAEELDTDWNKVEFMQAPADKAYTNPIIGMQLTGAAAALAAFGSRCVRPALLRAPCWFWPLPEHGASRLRHAVLKAAW